MTTQKQAGNKRPRGVDELSSKKGFRLYLPVIAAMLSLAFVIRPAEGHDKTTPTQAIARGEYLTTILGCAGCHTEGGLEGLPYGEPLAGSKIGIAYTAFEPSTPPAVVFPSNLTSDKAHGLGKWSSRQIARAIRGGINHTGGEVITVMPWMNYALLHRKDINAIVNYLQSLPPVPYEIPDPITIGEPSTQPYVRIGVYHFTPSTGPFYKE